MDDDSFLSKQFDPDVLSILKQYLSESKENKVENVYYTIICHLYKGFILNSIRDRTANGFVSDSILDSLILIEKFDRQQGIPPSDAMRDAFRAVAVYCTLKCLAISRSSFFDAVQRIWSYRIKNLVDSGVSNLLSPALAQWRMDIEAAVWDMETLHKLLPIGTLDEALNCIRVYLIEAFSSLAPALRRSPVVPSADHVASASIHSEGEVNPGENSHSSPGRHEGAGIVVDLEEDQSSSGEVNELLPTMLKTRTVGLEAGPTGSLHNTLEVAETFASNMEIESLNEEDSDKDKGDPTTSVSPATHHFGDEGKLNLRENSHSSPGRHEGSVNIVDLDKDQSSSGEVNELLPTVLKTRIDDLQAGPTDSPYEAMESAETFASNTEIESLHKEDSDKDRGYPKTSVSPATLHCNDKGKRTMRENSRRYKLCSSHRRRKGPFIISDLEEVERVASDMGNENLLAKDSVEHSNKDNGFAMANSRTIGDPNSTPRQYEEPAVIADTVEDRPTCRKFVLVSTPEIEKMRDSLKSSVSNLSAAVTDPLPQALDVWDRIASYVAAATKLQTDETVREDHDKIDRNVQAKRGAPDETIGKDQERMDESVPAPSVNHTTEPSQAKEGNEASIRPKKVRKTSILDDTIGKDQERMDGSVPAPSVDHTTEPSQAKEGNETSIRPKKVRRTSILDETIGKDQERMDGSVPAPSVDHTTEPSQAREGNEASIRPKKVRRTSLLERNNTANTVEWEDTVDSSAEGTSGSSNRCTLPSPKTKHASPLKKSEPLKWVRRRKVNRWTDVEEKALIEGVRKYGTRWKLISSKYEEILSNRTQVDLKDKWRVLSRK